MAAHACGILEFWIEWALVPSWKAQRVWHALGLVCMVLGQAMRSLAMVHASTNFSHALAREKRNDHVLVTTGVYAYVCMLTLATHAIRRTPASSGGR